MGQTMVERITEGHLADGPPKRPVRAGDFVSIRPRHILTHDNTAAVMKKFQGLGARSIRDPRQPVFALDHDIQNRTQGNLEKYRGIEQFAESQGVDFYPAGTGIGHQLMVEMGYVAPYSFVVASDSHANMYGALGAVGTPVVRTDAAAIWATGTFWWQVPRTVRVVLEGSLPPGVSGKDVIIALCGLYNQGEVLNAAVEFEGPGVSCLSLEARLTIANMTTEWGALVGWFPVDAVTLEYLEARRKALKQQGHTRLNDAPDPGEGRAGDGAYAGTITLNLSELTPHISGPDTVQRMTPIKDIEEKRIRVHKAYIVSCVNSRLEDLEAAAVVLNDKKVAPEVELYVSAASRTIQMEAESRGVWTALLDAGAKPLPPGCGPCIGLGAGLLDSGEVGISATNRNFKGRMGSRDAECYLASPAVVAASAVAGFITAPEPSEESSLTRRFVTRDTDTASPPPDSIEILEGFPRFSRGRLVFIPADNLNTDGIYGKDYTYREDMTPEAMARVVMENYDPDFAIHADEGDIVAGGYNFGTGSSREQAVTALQAKGIAMVIAASFSQTYLRNAFNNGFICIECPDFILSLRKSAPDAPGAKEKTIFTGDEVEVDFTTATVRWHGEEFSFAPLGPVPQSLVLAGGVEHLVRESLKTED